MNLITKKDAEHVAEKK